MVEIENDVCYLYMILCSNGAFYSGITADFLRRWDEHKRGVGARYVKYNGFRRAVFLKEYPNRSSARREEIALKNLSHYEKRKLVTSDENLLKYDLYLKCLPEKIKDFL